MALLNDPNQLSQIREALSERTVEGFVQFRPLAMAWLRRNLDGHTSMSVATLMNEHVESGGEIDRVIERREGHRDRHEFHFDFRLQIDRRPAGLHRNNAHQYKDGTDPYDCEHAS